MEAIIMLLAAFIMAMLGAAKLRTSFSTGVVVILRYLSLFVGEEALVIL